MHTLKNRFLANVLSIMIILGVFLSACASDQVATVNTVIPTKIQTPTTTPVPLPEITLQEGDSYFRIDGKPGFLFSRNLAAYYMDHGRNDYETLLDWSRSGGTQVVRLQVSSSVAGGKGYTNTGAIDETWAKKWEQVFEMAEAKGIYVWIVFSGWYDWNQTGYHDWENNSFNAANGGPAAEPGELFVRNSPTQELWLKWLKSVVTRWQGHRNILIWEPYSEVNLTEGVSEQDGVFFIEQTAQVIEDADPAHRPITNSLADIGEWPSFYRSESLDFINIHPYPPSAPLDTTVITDVRRMLEKYNKPVMIGESGLSAETPDSEAGKLSVAENAQLAAKHAIWAAVVSGAMNGRALYWEDSFGIYFPSLSWKYLKKYADLELPAARFVSEVDFTGFQPLTSWSSEKITGAAVGSEQMIIGWFRDKSCEPPDWSLQPVLSGQEVTVSVPGSTAEWKVDFYSTETGTELIASTTAARSGNQVTILLPEFTDDLAFKMYPQSGTVAEPVDPPTSSETTTDPIAGKWAGTIVGNNNSFSTTVEISVEPNCKSGNVCGTVMAPLLSCSGELFLQEVQDQTYMFIEQNMAGSASCDSGTYEYIHPESNGTLSLRTVYTSPSGEESVSSGILTQQ